MDVYYDGEQYVFGSGKHVGESFEQVAQSDPDYLIFVYWRRSVPWEDKAVWKLQDIMSQYSIGYHKSPNP